MAGWLKRFFEFEKRQTNFHTEIIAGTTTFLAMAYIIFVNPSILAAAGMDKTAQVTATCLATAVATILTAFVAKAPIAMAPGMGLNAFFAYTLVMHDKIRWETALGVVFLSGLFFFLLTVFGIRRKLVEAIPHSLIAAMSVGIGLFITLIGLVNLGLIVKSEETLIAAGHLHATVLIGLAGFLVMIILEMKNIRGSMIVGILAATLLAIAFGKVQAPQSLVTLKFNAAALGFKMDVLGAFKWSFFGAIFTLMFMDMFDSIGSLVACCSQAKLTDEKGNVRDLDKLLAVNAGATMIGAALGTSTTTTYVESVVGIRQGARTGFASLVTALWFLLGLLFAPLIAVVPAYATAPALVLVGFFMIREVRNIDFTDMEEGFPAFVIMVMIALCYSISTGLAFGFITFIVFKSIRGKWRDIKPVMWLIGLFSVVYFIL
ncbi:MAG: NCS2 family permease [Candidatus Omnitrophota bacterium]|jgi:AGZA family xanthine/uracil permease-like MFS transporter